MAYLSDDVRRLANLAVLERMRAEGWNTDDYDWKFVADPELRDQCDYVYPIPKLRNGNRYRTPYKRRRCEADGKFRNGDELRCGRHTPGVGSRGRRRVPRDVRSY